MNSITYETIAHSSEAIFRDKGSRFLAYAFPVKNLEEVKSYLNDLRELHPKAVHYCYAYRIGYDGALMRANDDGEPSGSAGRPILGQIDSLNLVNVLVVVVRYFGGVLLGVPGLINAYKTSALLALEQCEIIEKVITKTGELTCSYESLGEILNIIKSCDGEILMTNMQVDCQLQFALPLGNIEQFNKKMEKFYTIECNFI